MGIAIGSTDISAVYIGDTAGDSIYQGDTVVWGGPCLAFSGATALKVYDTTAHWDGVLEYSTDKTTWTEWDGTEITGGDDNCIYLRGTGNTVITGADDNRRRFAISGDDITISGDYRALLDYKNISSVTMGDYCFAHLFRANSGLVSVPDIIAESIPAYGCAYMFASSRNLTAFPGIKATTVGDYGFYRIFFDDYNFYVAQTGGDIEVETAGDCAFYDAYSYCAGLSTTPSISVTSAGEQCFYTMFGECSSLTSAPLLHITDFKAGCCQYMFMYCTGLSFSETQTDEYQYEYRLPASGTATAESDAFTSMLISTGGTFTGDPTVNTTYYTATQPTE